MEQQQSIYFEIHPATKQTREYVRNRLSDAAKTSKRTGMAMVVLRIIYGEHSGPATFLFEDGAVTKIKPYKGYSKPENIIFAVVS